MATDTNRAPQAGTGILKALAVVSGSVLLVAALVVAFVLVARAGRLRAPRHAQQREGLYVPLVSDSECPRFVRAVEFANVFRRYGHLGDDSPIARRYAAQNARVNARARGHEDPAAARTAYLDAFIERPCERVGKHACARLLMLARDVDRLLYAKRHAVPDAVPTSDFSFVDRLAALPWKFAVLEDDAEAGMAHTMGTVVCLPRGFVAALANATDQNGSGSGSNSSTRAAMRVLVHEKMHVFQTVYPWETSTLVQDMGYRKLVRRDHAARDLRDRLRANPDLDEYIYYHFPTRCAPVAAFRSWRPTSLHDASVLCLAPDAVLPSAHFPRSDASTAARALEEQDEDGQRSARCEYEHPFEHLAYLVAAWATAPHHSSRN